MIAPAALAAILSEFQEELEERDPSELLSAEQVGAELTAFVAERMPADEEVA
jgi:hypothetical protein